ncbi:MAG TPA: hypothetical protein PKA06_11760 [Gemmatales bacterium]|nr:hypothetical protein [Gemmatales bacterium]
MRIKVCLLLLALAGAMLLGCSSPNVVEMPKDPKPAPTETPKVRNAADGYQPGR